MREQLHARHRHLWAEHAHTLLDALAGDVDDVDPRLSGYASRLQAGRLLRRWEFDHLTQPPARSRRQVQHAALGDYPTRRAAHVAQQHQSLPWLTRRRTSPDQLATAYDHAQLLVCDTCAILTPRAELQDHPWQEDSCRHCGAGRQLDYRHRHQVPTLAQRLDAIRAVAHSRPLNC